MKRNETSSTVNVVELAETNEWLDGGERKVEKWRLQWEKVEEWRVRRTTMFGSERVSSIAI